MPSLVIPIDASQLTADERKEQKVKVAVQERGKVKSKITAIDASGKGEIKLEVDSKQPLVVAVGPDTATDEDIFHLQTLTVNVSPEQWRGAATLKLPPFVVTQVWWRLWLRWCRTFTINGRVVCADGSPVPGAQVRAYDVDFFWWWSSSSQVGPSVVTDATGHFTIKFRWCCGWWPWWWWQLRKWRLDADLVDKIRPVVALNPRIPIPEPDPVPRLDFASLNPQPLPPRPPLSPAVGVARQIDPSTIPVLRDRLISVLPRVPEFERLRIWPWWPWTPWFDCAPDVIFRVTQVCGGGPTKTIVSENVFQARWDIPTTLNVTLVANSEACCVGPIDPDPVGDCALITGVCGDPGIAVTNIGRTGVLAGYADPGGPLNPGGRDRPFAETITLVGQFGSAAQADYYEIEYRPHSGGPWTPVPDAALLDFSRGYFDSTLAWPNQWVYPVPFEATTHNTPHVVYESRRHYEATHPPANWGSALTGRAWYYNVNTLAVIQSKGIFSDDAYDFQIVGYKALPNGDLDPTTRKVMDGCGNNQNNNLIVLRFDNRIVNPPTPGSVHWNTTEPDCGITAVRLGASTVLPCGQQQLGPGTPLEIDFFATDPDGHLDHYELNVKYDLGSIKNLLSVADVGAFTLSALTPGASPGPDYANALSQSSTRPTWTGGSMRLHINDASNVFPKTCCYLIELTVWKRNIVGCDGDLNYYNQMHYSFTVTV